MMKLLIVDDSAMIRHKIEQSLKHPDIIVAGSAGNGQQALQECKRLLPDVVTLDLAMPVMGGVECVEHILRIKPDTLILIVSALADQATALNAIKKGANGFLAKPFTVEALNNSLDELLRSRLTA